MFQSKYINIELLNRRCTQTIPSFYKFGSPSISKDGVLIYKDNGKKILAVAHLDTVQDVKSGKLSDDGKVFHSPALDDRLGAHIILDVLPKMMGGYEYDILLTEGEEVGRSTAAWFIPPRLKQYNWMFEIDRSGLQSVMYSFETPEYKSMLENFGFKIGNGSFTDICYLTDLGCFGVNFASAYYDNHGPNAHVKLDELDQQIEKIVNFIWYKKDIIIPHVYPNKWYIKKDTVRNLLYREKTNYSNYNNNRYQQYGGRNNRRNNNFGSNGKANSHIIRHNLPNSKSCELCDNGLCKGLEKCSSCQLFYHRSLTTNIFGICEHCLRRKYLVDWQLIDDLTSPDVDKGEEAVNNIVALIFNEELKNEEVVVH